MRTPPGWPPLPGAIVRVNGWPGRYIGGGLGAYRKWEQDVAPADRRVLVYRAHPAKTEDLGTHVDLLPTDAQLEVARREFLPPGTAAADWVTPR